MVELGIVNFKKMCDFKVRPFNYPRRNTFCVCCRKRFSCSLLLDQNEKSMAGSKPCLSFQGSLFTTNADYAKIKILLADFFRGPTATNVNLAGLDHLISFTATEAGILMRHYRIMLKKSGSRLPLAEVIFLPLLFCILFLENHFSSLIIYVCCIDQRNYALLYIMFVAIFLRFYFYLSSFHWPDTFGKNTRLWISVVRPYVVFELSKGQINHDYS